MNRVVKQSTDKVREIASHGTDFLRVRDDWPSVVLMALIKSQIIYGKNAPTADAARIHGIGFPIASWGARMPARMAMNTHKSQPVVMREKPAKTQLVKR